ncbi:MAG: hypothetical protein HY924_02615 [Elusimicrobia bacterium]|nr:hypothetical protein [Elusimicrobiota bacterium]
MRYWIFQNNQVLGPHDADELSALPYFSSESLVCPEGRKGTSMGDWQRAGLVPELSLSLVKSSQLAMASAGDSPRVLAGLPPEPTLKDLAALGSLQEKVSFLENTLSLLQGELRMKDTELSTMHTQLEDRGVQALELKKKLEGLEAKLGELGDSLKENLQKAVDEERGVASDVAVQSKALAGLSDDLHKLQDGMREVEKIKEELSQIEKPVSEIEKIKEDLQQIGKKVDDAAASASAAASAGPAFPAAQPEPAAAPAEAAPFSAQPAPAFQPEPAAAPAEAAPFSAQPAPAFQPEPAFTPLAEASAAPKSESAPGMQPIPEFTPAPVSMPEPGGPGSFGVGLPDAVAGLPSGADDAAARFAKSAADAAAPVVADLAPAKPKRGKFLIFAVAGIALAGVAAFFLGLIPLGKKPAPPPPPVVEAPPPPPPPAEPPPEVVEAQRKEQALEIARAWPLPNGNTVGTELEPAAAVPAASAAGGLTPWMVEKVRDGFYQANFYPSKGSPHGTEALAFEVSLESRSVKPLNKPAENLLAGRPVVEPPKPKRKPAKPKKDEEAAALFEDAGTDAKPADLSEVDELFGAPPEAAPVPAPKPARAGRRKIAIEPKPAEPSLDDLLAPEPKKAEPLPAEPVPARPAKKAAAPEPEADDAKLLDDLLGE